MANSSLLLARANTPLKRSGLLLIAAAILLWSSAAIYWNFNQGPFIYSHTENYVDRSPLPAEVSGSFWTEHFNGWRLYKTECVAEAKRKASIVFPTFSGGRPIVIAPSFFTPPDSCIEQFMPHKRRLVTTWHQDFTDFLSALVTGSYRRAGYFWLNFVACFSLALGGLMVTGQVEKLIRWIKTGT